MTLPRIFTGGMTSTNGYLLPTQAGSIMIDAPEGSLAWLEGLGIKPIALLLTHQHFDHVLEAGAIQGWAQCPTYAFAMFDESLTLALMLRAIGMEISIPPYTINHLVAGGSSLQIGGQECCVSHVPGHSPDSVAFYFPSLGLVFSGDTLMAGGVGRTDFPGGSMKLLTDGIWRHLLSLPPETRLFGGHGEPSSIGEEIANNPFLA